MKKQMILIPDANRDDGLHYQDARNMPFALHGLLYENGAYRRLPEALAKNISPGAYERYIHTSGGRLRFVTDSRQLAIQVQAEKITRFDHMPLSATLGFDLYEGKEFIGILRPPVDCDGSYSQTIALPEGEKEYTLYFPLYNGVTSLMIGLTPGASVKPPAPFEKPPVIFYGSSITQGGCASRAGLSYPSILGRELDVDICNLALSGSAKGERILAEYFAGLSMSAFVYDYDHNAPTADHLEKSHGAFLDIIRAAQPDLPILLLSRPNGHTFTFGAEEDVRRRRIIEENWRVRVASGDRNLYFIPGEELWAGERIGDCTVDGCHPNDLGFYRMAKVMKTTLNMMLNRG